MWKKFYKVIIRLIIISVILVLCLIIVDWDWGFKTFTTENKINGITIEIEHPAKTLWDILDLLIIPVVLAFGVFYLNKEQSRKERLIASNQEEESLLQNYIDAMSALILEKHLLQTNEKCAKERDLRNIARSRTLTVLRGLVTPNQDENNRRRASLIIFLYESELIIGKKPIISLLKANLNKAYFRKQDLKNANLQGVSLEKADLRGADLQNANLEGAYLCEAKLQGANFKNAKLNKANLKGAFYGRYGKYGKHTEWPLRLNIIPITWLLLRQEDSEYTCCMAGMLFLHQSLVYDKFSSKKKLKEQGLIRKNIKRSRDKSI